MYYQFHQSTEEKLYSDPELFFSENCIFMM